MRPGRPPPSRRLAARPHTRRTARGRAAHRACPSATCHPPRRARRATGAPRPRGGGRRGRRTHRRHREYPAMAAIETSATQPRTTELMLDFLAYLELERGLSRNTLEAYRSDLLQYGAFLGRRGRDPLAVSARDLNDF